MIQAYTRGAHLLINRNSNTMIFLQFYKKYGLPGGLSKKISLCTGWSTKYYWVFTNHHNNTQI